MIYVFLASGFEETEAIAPIDILRRAELQVKTVGVGAPVVIGSHGIPVVCDIQVEEVILDEDIDMIVLPGGMPGTLNLEQNAFVQNIIKYCYETSKYIAAICAAPSILGHKGYLDGKTAVCFPGFENQLNGATIENESVCVDGTIITSRGAGTAIDFGLKMVEVLVSKQKSNLLGASLQCKSYQK